MWLSAPVLIADRERRRIYMRQAKREHDAFHDEVPNEAKHETVDEEIPWIDLIRLQRGVFL